MAPATSTTAAATATTGGSANGTSGTIIVKGAVDNPMTLTVADLKKMTVVQITATHPKLGEQNYSGVRFSDLLTLFKVQSSATVVDIGCIDGYMAEIALADIQKTPDALLAIGDDGKLNVVMPGMAGKAWATDATSFEFK
jgi:DMSO/TMAO reductase YedYZ molybdopterin-dependent catalytic subunit